MHLSSMAKPANERQGRPRSTYRPPEVVHEIQLSDLLRRIGRPSLERRQLALLQRGGPEKDVTVFYSGALDLLDGPAVSIVGTRDVSEQGRERAGRLARDLAQAGVLVVSGLAKGVDTAAHQSALQGGGPTAAVIGTPIDKAYPAENASLQEMLCSEFLVLSPFPIGQTVFKGNFPARNRVMAAITDATVIVEASDTSGTLHQAAECQRLGRWLFIERAVVDNPAISWPKRFLDTPRTVVIDETKDILARIE